MRIGRHVEALIQDVRFSLRWLLRERAFTVTVLVTLALSIGSTTAVLTLVDVLLLRPLPVKSPERLFTLSEPGRDVDLNPSVLLAWVLRAFAELESSLRQPARIVDRRFIRREPVRRFGHGSRALRARIRKLLRRPRRWCGRGADPEPRRRSDTRGASGRRSELCVLATPIRGSAGCRRACGVPQRHPVYRHRRGETRLLRHETGLRAGRLGAADDGQAGHSRQHPPVGTQPELPGDDGSSRTALRGGTRAGNGDDPLCGLARQEPIVHAAQCNGFHIAPDGGVHRTFTAARPVPVSLSCC